MTGSLPLATLRRGDVFSPFWVCPIMGGCLKMGNCLGVKQARARVYIGCATIYTGIGQEKMA